MVSQPGDLVRITLGVFFIAVLTVASLWILQPFLPAIVWATMIVVPTWGLMRAVQARLWGMRPLAVTVMVLALIITFFLPLWLAISAVIANADTIAVWTRGLSEHELPSAPAWLEHLPVIGQRAAAGWNEVAAQGMPELRRQLWPHVQRLLRWGIRELGGFGILTVQFLLAVVVAAIFYTTGERVVEGVRRFGRRLAGEHGERAVLLTGQAIRGVALGVVVTAFLQALVGGVGLAIAGVPFVATLTGVMLFLGIIQIGPGLVVLIATIWLFWRGENGWGVMLAVWTVLVMSLDHVMRPLLIRRAAKLPLLLIIVGVVGGIIAFGMVGIFIGPIVLAVTYTLLASWVQETSTKIEDKAE